jgi:chromatin modification-related protein VID21
MNFRTRLLSRKRKLAELFSVTATEDLDDYKRQLQAFQDANDLEKYATQTEMHQDVAICSDSLACCAVVLIAYRARHFDEVTLPPQRHSNRLTRRTQASQHIPDTSSRRPTPQRLRSPSKADSLLSPRPSQSSRGPSPRRASPLPISKTQKIQPQRDLSIQDVAGDIEEGSTEHGRVDGDSEETGIQISSNAIPRPHSPQLLVSSTEVIPEEASTRRKNSPKNRESPSRNTQLKPDVEQSRRSRSPLALAPVTNGADPQSSPASTNGPVSSNTPAPDGGSPNTSPEEEDATVTSTRFHQSKSDRPKGLDVPRRPDTPDSTQGAHYHDSSVMEVGRAEELHHSEEADQPQPENGSPSPSTEDIASRKPSMRIDTQTNINTFFRPVDSSGMVESPAPMTMATATPRRPVPPTPSGQDTSKRATRISSGVLQKKSVSEILGETPKPSLSDSVDTGDARESSLDSQGRLDRRDKDRSKLSTVVFAKPQKPLPDGDTIELSGLDPRAAHQRTPSDRDYLYTLFENKAHSMHRQGSLSYLIQNAHKTLSTADHLVDYQMQSECRVLKRIYQLQEKQRWALRQYKRADEAPRSTSHWDFLLDHARWMRSDFRQERKWRLAAARAVAESCAEWVASSPDERKQLQAKTRHPRILSTDSNAQDVEMVDGPGPAISSQPTPELVPSNEEDSHSIDLADPKDMSSTVPPAAIFSLGESEYNFAVDKTPAFDKLLNELPLYKPSVVEPDLSKSDLAEKLDARWRNAVIPVSKYTVEKLETKDHKPPRKRSRYEYEVETSPTRKTEPLPPQEQNVALFMVENKHIRDRIHPGHSFRPPSEHPMPSQTFFETRSSSQWTHAEDDELRKLVKDYSYNWSLISSCLSPRSLYTSGADRRTPWECFERWIGLEGLPADMSKTPYFKTYSGRIEAAGRHVAAQIEEAQRRAGANVQIPARKRTTQPVRVDRKRTQRHLAMLDVMRKLAKKRETTLQKQQHQADLAAMRKVSEVNQPKAPFKKPSEYAALRQERDQKRAEQQEIYRQQLLAHQRAAAQAQRGQISQANGMPNGLPNGMRPPSSGMAGIPNGNLQVPNVHPRPHPAMMAGMNGVPMPPGMMGPKNLAQAQAQLQAGMGRGITSPQQMRMLQEATKVQQEQLLRQAQQQAQQGGPHSSPNGPHASLVNGQGMNNAAYLAAMAGTNGAPSPSGAINGNASSPRSQGSNPGQALSSGHTPFLIRLRATLREQHPQATDEEIQKMATQQLTAWQQQATAAAAGQTQKRPQPHNQAALNAAMGAVNAGAHSANNAALAAAQYGQGMMTNEQVQQYNQRMRMQAQAAQRGMPVPGAMQQGMMGPMGTSPVMTMARPVSQHGQMSRSATPRDQRSNSQSTSNPGGQQGSPRPGSSAMQA